MKRRIQLLACAATMTAYMATAAVPAGYYDSLEGLSGPALKKAVKALAEGHTVIHYGDADPDNTFNPIDVGTWTVFQESDTRTVNDNLVWWDMYSSNNMRVADGHIGLNIEHSVANSWWGGKAVKEPYNDLHHLNPSNGDANGAKSNYPLGIVGGTPNYQNGVTTVGAPAAGYGGGASRVFQPHDVYKGDFARAYFYIFTTYDDISWSTDADKAYMYDPTTAYVLKPWAYQMLLQWAKEDPVSHKELSRNDAIYKYQKNRNPFIDCPELADHIWGDKQNVAFHYSLYTPAADDPEYPGWDEDPIEMHQSQWQPISTAGELSEDYDYIIVSPTKNRAMTYTLVSNKAFEECFYSPMKELATYPDVITAIPPQTAIIRLEAGNGGWYLKVYDLDDNYYGYMRGKGKGETVLTQSKDANCLAKITPAADRTVINFTISNTEYSFQYNSGSNPRFATYTSNQAPVQLYRPTDEELSDPEEEDPSAGIGTGLPENEPEVITAIYDLNGRRLNATSVLDLDKGLYIVVSNFGTRKIRK